MTYFSLLTRMQKKASRQKVFRMISSAPDLKHILQKLNILGQRQIIQPVPVVSDCLGHFVPIYQGGSVTNEATSSSKELYIHPSSEKSLLCIFGNCLLYNGTGSRNNFSHAKSIHTAHVLYLVVQLCYVVMWSCVSEVHVGNRGGHLSKNCQYGNQTGWPRL